MPFCAIITCDARTSDARDKNKYLYFHRFPANQEVREKWVEMTGRDNWTPKDTSVICSKHFRDTDYTIKRSGNRYLKSTAVPCEFVFYKPFILDESPIELLPPSPLSLPVLQSPPSPPIIETNTDLGTGNMYPVQPGTDVDFNQNLIEWDPFKPKINLEMPLSPSDSYFSTPRHGSPVYYLPPSTYFPPSMLYCPLLKNNTPPPSPRDAVPISKEKAALEEIKSLLAKYKTYSVRAVARACIAEVKEAKDIKLSLLNGNMDNIQKAEAIITLQEKHTKKFVAKYKRLRKLTKKIARIVKSVDTGTPITDKKE